MWVRNLKTGMEWEVSDDVALRLKKDEDYEAIDAPGAKDTPLFTHVDAMDYNELKDEAKRLGIPNTGKKEDLAEAIKAKLAE